MSGTFNGIAFHYSRIRIKDIPKGTSAQIAFGEKYLDPRHYNTGGDPGDNEGQFSGFNNDHCRTTYATANGQNPKQDKPAVQDTKAFGSLHPSGCNFAFTDGSVRTINYDVDFTIFQPLGDRFGLVTELP